MRFNWTQSDWERLVNGCSVECSDPEFAYGPRRHTVTEGYDGHPLATVDGGPWIALSEFPQYVDAGKYCDPATIEPPPKPSAREQWMTNATRWTGSTPTGNWEAFGYVGSYGGASLQACVTVLLFAAYAEEAWARGRSAQTVDGQPDYSHPSYDD